MTANSPFSAKTVQAGSRQFLVHMAEFENGRFVSVTEGDRARIGAMTVSLASGPVPATTPVIPAKAGSLFLTMAAERLSTAIQGIAIVSVSIKSELDAAAVRALVQEIMEMARNV